MEQVFGCIDWNAKAVGILIVTQDWVTHYLPSGFFRKTVDTRTVEYKVSNTSA
jgi:hypothetical protein